MATPEEKQQLYDALKFTPRTYSISMWGYGGEIVMGKIDRKIFDYFKHRRLSVEEFAWGYEYAEDNNIPDEMCPFEPGSWYECDSMAHGSGATRDCATLQITDENGEVVVEQSVEDIDGDEDGIQLSCNDETYIGQANPGEVVFIGRSSEKGTFFEGEFHLTKPFDITKLEVQYDEVDGEEYVTSIFYDGEEIDNNGANTNGKSSDFGFFLVKEDKSWESYKDHDSIQYPLTEWFSKKINPTRLGNYIIKTAGKDGYEYQARWTGSRWITTWADDKPETEALNVKQWRGITYDPDTEVPPEAEKQPVPRKKTVAKPKVKKLNVNAAWPF